MIVDANQLEKMLQEFENFNSVKQKEKEYWIQKVDVKKTQAMLHDEYNVMKMINMEKQFRELQKDEMIQEEQDVIDKRKKEAQDKLDKRTGLEDRFLD